MTMTMQAPHPSQGDPMGRLIVATGGPVRQSTGTKDPRGNAVYIDSNPSR